MAARPASSSFSRTMARIAASMPETTMAFGDVTERRGHGRLRTGLDVQEGGERTEHAGDAVAGLDQASAGVLALQSDPQGLAAGAQAGTLALGGGLAGPQ